MLSFSFSKASPSLPTMVIRASHFDALPTSEVSDPALVSHRLLESDGTDHEDAPSTSNTIPQDKSMAESSPNGLTYGDRLKGESQRHANLPNGDGARDVEYTAGGSDETEEETFLCGLGRWFSPSWIQPLASKQMFLAVFCLACVLQGMFFTYFVSVLTTIEKLFQIQSKTTGIIMSATEIGQIGGALLLTYFGGQGHRPKWIGWGMVLFGTSAGLCSLPHFLFWRTKPNMGSSTSSISSTTPSRIFDMPGSLSPTDPSLMATPQQREMDLICRMVENSTRMHMEDEASELERNLECSSE